MVGATWRRNLWHLAPILLTGRESHRCPTQPISPSRPGQPGCRSRRRLDAATHHTGPEAPKPHPDRPGFYDPKLPVSQALKHQIQNRRILLRSVHASGPQPRMLLLRLRTPGVKSMQRRLPGRALLPLLRGRGAGDSVGDSTVARQEGGAGPSPEGDEPPSRGCPFGLGCASAQAAL
jgi:hypothetical protein